MSYENQQFGDFKLQNHVETQNGVQVYAALNLTNNTQAIARVYPNASSTSQVFISDIHKIQSLNYDHLVKMYSIQQNGSVVVSFEEYVPYTLEQFLQENPVNFEQTQSIFAQIAKGLDNLKSNGISHQNISTSSILIDFQENVKLTGFGLAPQYRSLDLIYQSPQYIKDKSQVNMKNDMWSLGIVLYQLTFRNYPFQACTDESQQLSEFSSIQGQSQLKFSDNDIQRLDGQQIPDQVSVLLNQLIVYNESDRTSQQEVSFRGRELYKYFYEPRKSQILQQQQQQQDYQQQQQQQQQNEIQTDMQNVNLIDDQQQYQEPQQKQQQFNQKPTYQPEQNQYNYEYSNNNGPKKFEINLVGFGKFPNVIKAVNDLEQQRVIEQNEYLYQNSQNQDPDHIQSQQILSESSKGETKQFLQIQIPSYQIKETSIIKKTAFYRLCSYPVDSQDYISVERRYSQFEELHHYFKAKSILLNQTGVIIPNLPPPDYNLDSLKLQAVNLFKKKDEELQETEFLKKRQLDLLEYLENINQIEFIKTDSCYTQFLTIQDFQVPKLKIPEENFDIKDSYNRQKESIKSKGFGSYLSNKFKKAKDSTLAYSGQVLGKNKGQVEENQDWIKIQKMNEEVKEISKNINAQVIKTLTLSEQSKLRMIRGYQQSAGQTFGKLTDWQKTLQYLANLERERETLEAKQKVNEKFNSLNGRFQKACSIYLGQLSQLKIDLSNNLQQLLRLVGDRVH